MAQYRKLLDNRLCRNPYQTCILKSRDLAETFAETYGHISAMPTLLI